MPKSPTEMMETPEIPAGAPFGAVEIDVAGCTLCLSCVSACPTGALTDDPERPMLRFAEDACVQCGLCKATCPEKVINLVPRIDFRAATAASHVLKEEEPFPCIRCGKPDQQSDEESARALSALPHAARSAAPFGAALDHLPAAAGSRRSFPQSVLGIDPRTDIETDRRPMYKRLRTPPPRRRLQGRAG
jgi:ferredoxin